MQAELLYGKRSRVADMMSTQNITGGTCLPKNRENDNRETIHSGHFMVSNFEAEAQDDEDELAVPVPEEEVAKVTIMTSAVNSFKKFISPLTKSANSSQQLSIETSLNKLFQCMSLAYRQKLTSPKWNRFKGIRLRWKDKIRLNNVIWRCWHLQFILKQNTLVCQFASPLDVDTHNKPEAVVLEGKYWKRKLAAVTAEYKKWRMFYRNKSFGLSNKDGHDMLESMDMFHWSRELANSESDGSAGNYFGGNNGMSSGDIHNMMVDEDYMELMTDTLFSTITSNQPIYFPDPREIARGANLADFIQPSLGPLQPNLDDFMDTLEPLQEFFNAKLPPVPEEDDVFRSGQLNNTYPDLDIMTSMNQTNENSGHSAIVNPQNVGLENMQYTSKMYPQSQQASPNVFRNTVNTIDNFNLNNSKFETSLPATGPQLMRDKSQSKAQVKPVRSSQYSSTQQNIYQNSPQNQNLSFHAPQSQTQQSYAINVQTVPLISTPNQIQLSVLNDQPNTNNLTQITAELIEPSQTFAQTTSRQKELKPTLPTLSVVKPYKIVQPPQQSYKYSVPSSNFAVPQFKFGNNSGQKNKPLGLDLTTPTSQPTKLLPRPATTVSSIEKNEVFAVPKVNYQMKSRSRSRSSSSITTSKANPRPLLSAVSDPSLNVNNNALLAHLLTNNTPNVYAVNNTTNKISSEMNQPTTVKHILPMITNESSAVQIGNAVRSTSTSINVQSNMQSTLSSMQAQRQQVIQAPSGNQVLLNTNNQTHQSHSNPNSPKDSTAHSPQSLSISPLHSPMSFGSPLSPTRAFGKSDTERGQYKEQRRVGHIHAEQKRRYNIKNGFDMLHSLIPQLSQNPNTKLSKAAMLQKGAEYIKQLKSERNNLKEEMETLRRQIECLNASINNCQLMLPATGAPVSRSRTNKMKEMFDEYVRIRTRENWKFWIFSILLEPLMSSFNTCVSTQSIEDLCKTTISWVEQHCSLVDLRPAVLNSLKYLCTATDILTNPDRLEEEAFAAISQTEQRNS